MPSIPATGRSPVSRLRSPLLLAGLPLLLLSSAAGVVGARIWLEGSGTSLERLAAHRSSTITRIYARGNEEIGSFARERRVPVTYASLPRRLVEAIVSVEDAGFFGHSGLNLRGIARAAVTNVRAGRVVEGGSSLTQQLAKVLFLSPERTFKRKLEEAALALDIERRYSKEEILELYCNEIYLGHNRYGFEAASRFYFGRPLGDLRLAELALLAGLPQRPVGYSPLRDPEAARRRRSHVLARMAELGYITGKEAEEAGQQPLGVRPRDTEATGMPRGAYFVEEVRQALEERYGEQGLYREGLRVQTTLDARLQEVAERVVREGVAAVERREREPAGGGPVEGALVALDVHSGAIRALVGGRDFARSRFDRAVQARRQTGSAFKPIVYATALAAGMTPADRLFDEPYELVDSWTGDVYAPRNHERDHHGLTTVREAIERSMNPLSVQVLKRVGAEAVIGTARRLGIDSRLEPWPSLALGSFEMTLLEMTAAYAALANQGVAQRPFAVVRVESRDGEVLERREPEGHVAVSPEVAYLTTSLLQGVIQRGTGRRARALGRPLAGKTGTTDDYTDAWFIGYSPDLAVGVWVGRDEKQTLGHGEEGSRAALPIWMAFMEEALAGTPAVDFVRPPGIELRAIDPRTGLRATESCGEPFMEAFLRGTAPVRFCSQHEHALRAMPWYMQKEALEGDAGTPLASVGPEP